MAKKEKKTLEEQANQILKMAEEKGVEANFFFVTTFERYLKQVEQLKVLEEEIASEGVIVSKEYVKGRKNIYTNPALNAHTKITDSANRTVTTLSKIVKEWIDSGVDESDPLMALINGGEEE